MANSLALRLEKDKDDPVAGNWFVEVFLDNRPYAFILDTGAALSSVQCDEFTKSLPVIRHRESSGAFQKQRDDIVEVSEIRVGPISKMKFELARRPKKSMGGKNLLGMNFFKDFAFEFLFDQNRVLLLDKGSGNVSTPFTDLFLDETFHPYVDLSWPGGHTAKGVWDTGAGMTCFDLTFVKKHPELFVEERVSIGQDSSGHSAETPIFRTKSFDLGGRSFEAADVAVIDLSVANSTIKTPMDFILGYNVIRQAHWIFDFPQRQWAITEMTK